MSRAAWAMAERPPNFAPPAPTIQHVRVHHRRRHPQKLLDGPDVVPVLFGTGDVAPAPLADRRTISGGGSLRSTVP